ncbi:MAG: hypothetical protein IJN36_05460 [Clostridia bacterium]|nr:hypothetical protein [Clostridia bacterium]
MRDMLTMNATDVRKNWSEVADTVIRTRPQFIKRTRDYMMLSNCELVEALLEAYSFTADRFVETDGSITLSLNEIDLIENAATEKEAKRQLAEAIMDYATEFYNEFNLWSSAPNRKGHIPYVLKALIFDDIQKIEECIKCQAGKN